MPTKMGLFARLSFDGGKAVTGMRQASGAFRGMSQAARGAQQAATGVKQVMGGMTIAATAMSAGVGVALKKASNFESQMATVKGLVTLNAKLQKQTAAEAARDVGKLNNLAKKLGASTRFTATQAAEGIEVMTRAGFAVDDVVSGLPGVLQAAAAENIGLADATNVVAGVLRQFNLDSSQATKVADILAATSAATNTNILELGEAFRYGGLQAATLGISAQDTAAMMGLLANSTLKASVGGTSLTNMLVKLAKPTSKGAKLIKEWGVRLKDARTKELRPMGDIVKDLTKALAGQDDVLQRTADLQEVFGRRGARAAIALVAAQKKVEKQFGKSATAITDLSERLNQDGAAADLAEAKLDSLSGQITILGSALEGFAIEAMEPFMRSMTGGVKGFSTQVQDVATALRLLNADTTRSTEEFKAQWSTVPESAREFAEGVMEGIAGVKEGFQSLKQTFSGVMSFFGMGGSPRETAKLMTQVVGLAPAILGLAAALKVLSMGFGMAAGGAKILAGSSKMLLGAGRAGVGAGKGVFGALARFGAGRIPGGKAAAAAAGVGLSAAAQGQPVYVTNFHELAMMGGVGGAAGKLGKGAAAAAGGKAAGGWAFTGARGLGRFLLGGAGATAGAAALGIFGSIFEVLRASAESINLIGDYEKLARYNPLREMAEKEKRQAEARKKSEQVKRTIEARTKRAEFGGEMDFGTLATARQLGGRFLEKARAGLMAQAETLAAEGETSKVTRILRELGTSFRLDESGDLPKLAMAEQERKRLAKLRRMKSFTPEQRGELARLAGLEKQLADLTRLLGVTLAGRQAGADVPTRAELDIRLEVEGQQLARAMKVAEMNWLKGTGETPDPEVQRTMEYTGFAPPPSATGETR